MTNPVLNASATPSLTVGLVGTGYAAKLRADALQADPRARLVAIAGHTPEKVQAFSDTYAAEAAESWEDLVQRSLDLVVIASVNQSHGAIVRAALQLGKHVVVEYPLSLDVAEAEALIALAHTQNKLLHVEHIELLGGVHQALQASLSQIGTPFHARYATINPQHPAPQRWSYHRELFGFPLMGALSRLHRLTDLFGSVATVSCQTRFWDVEGGDEPSPYYRACLCLANLKFSNGLLAEVVYGKGETFWQAERMLQVHGDTGKLIFDGDQGTLVQAQGSQSLQVGGRRGLFAKDTAMVLDHLLTDAPLYVTPEASLYTLKVADAAWRSALNHGQIIDLT